MSSAKIIKRTVVALAIGLALYEGISLRRENAALREQLAAERTESILSTSKNAVDSRSAESPIPTGGSRPTLEKKLTSEEIESTLRDIILSRLWRTDGQQFEKLMNLIEAKDMPRAMAFVTRNASGQNREVLTFSLASRWSRMDPAAAERWAETLPNGDNRDHLRMMISGNWAEQDPEAAIKFAGPSYPALNAIAKRSPSLAAQTALATPTGDPRRMAVTAVAENWLEQDPPAAVKWISSLSEPSDLAAALPAMIRFLGTTNPKEVASYIASLPSDEALVNVGSNFAEQWASDDPTQAAVWAIALPKDAALRDKAVGAVAQRWANDDPQTAASWLSTLSGPDRETAVAAFVQGAARDEPQLAANWATTLSDQNAGDQALQQVMQNWMKSDPASAAQWLAQTSLSDDRKRKLNPNH